MSTSPLHTSLSCPLPQCPLSISLSHTALPYLVFPLLRLFDVVLPSHLTPSLPSNSLFIVLLISLIPPSLSPPLLLRSNGCERCPLLYHVSLSATTTPPSPHIPCLPVRPLQRQRRHPLRPLPPTGLQSPSPPSTAPPQAMCSVDVRKVEVALNSDGMEHGSMIYLQHWRGS